MTPPRVPVIRMEEATVYLEQYREYTFGHCDVHKWTPGVAKKLKTAWKDIMRLHGGPIFALHDPGDDKHRKWCELFGFKFSQEVDCTDGITRHVYVCHSLGD